MVARRARPRVPLAYRAHPLLRLRDVPRGRFIVIEGIDGAGTTTQTRRLVAWMNQRYPAGALGTREPTGGPIGSLLREILAGAHPGVPGPAMALLFAADRLHHVATKVEPSLASGIHVVSDRYYHSSLAYQAEEAERAFVEHANSRAPHPDLTFLLRVSPERAAQRRAEAGRPTERYDDLALQTRIADNYDREMARLAKTERIVIIDGEASVDEVHERLKNEVQKICA
jgi:dTMP kinase